MRYRFLLIAATPLIAVLASESAFAIPAFSKVFVKEYVVNNENKQFAEEAAKSPNSCYICHQGKERKNRNAFGKEVGKLLDKKKDAKNEQKISDSIKKALEQHVDPKDDKSETYMDRVKAGKYPAGTLEQLKKDPPKDSAAK
jgi:cytochrome c2